MSILFLLLLLTATSSSVNDMPDVKDEDELPPEPIDFSGNGRSFFFFGTLFRRWRDRWLAFHNPAPLYAGAAYPINGFYNCPPFGCNPSTITPQPGYYPGGYYASSPLGTQQQQQTQGSSNVYIYQSDQNNPTALAPGAPAAGFYGPGPAPGFGLFPRAPAAMPNYQTAPALPLPPRPALPVAVGGGGIGANSYACTPGTFGCVG